MDYKSKFKRDNEKNDNIQLELELSEYFAEQVYQISKNIKFEGGVEDIVIASKECKYERSDGWSSMDYMKYTILRFEKEKFYLPNKIYLYITENPRLIPNGTELPCTGPLFTGEYNWNANSCNEELQQYRILEDDPSLLENNQSTLVRIRRSGLLKTSGRLNTIPLITYIGEENTPPSDLRPSGSDYESDSRLGFPNSTDGNIPNLKWYRFSKDEKKRFTETILNRIRENFDPNNKSPRYRFRVI